MRIEIKTKHINDNRWDIIAHAMCKFAEASGFQPDSEEIAGFWRDFFEKYDFTPENFLGILESYDQDGIVVLYINKNGKLRIENKPVRTGPAPPIKYM